MRLARHRDYLQLAGRQGWKSLGWKFKKKRTLRGGGSAAFNLRLSLPLLARKSCVCEATKPPRIPLKLQSKIALLYLVDSRAPRDALAPWRAPRYIHEGSFVRSFIVGENRATCFSKKEEKKKQKKLYALGEILSSLVLSSSDLSPFLSMLETSTRRQCLFLSLNLKFRFEISRFRWNFPPGIARFVNWTFEAEIRQFLDHLPFHPLFLKWKFRKNIPTRK